MEMKWYAITMVALFASLGISEGVKEYQQGQCKVAYATTNHTAEEIAKVCGK